MNPVVYEWQGGDADGRPLRRENVDAARRLLAEAGWPNGRNADRRAAGDQPRHHARRAGRQGALGLAGEEVSRSGRAVRGAPTDFNRFQDKIRQGNARSSSSSAGTPTIPIPRTVSSCSTVRRARCSTARTRPTTRTGIRRPLRAHEGHARRSRAPATHRPHGGDAAAGRAVDLRLPPHVVSAAARLG